MTQHSDDLEKVLDRFPNTEMLVVGDLILDHYVWGEVSRISPEAPVVVVNVTKESRTLGGAGNVVNNLVSLGARVSFAGVMGEDDEAARLQQLFSKHGVDGSGVVCDPARPTTIKTRILARGQQVVRVDRESTSPLTESLENSVCKWISEKVHKVAGVLVSDYAKGFITPKLYGCFDEAKAAGVFGLGKIPLVVDPKNANFDIYTHATVVKPNRHEAQAAAAMPIPDRSAAAAAGRKLTERWNSDMVLVTMGEQGMTLVSRDPQQPTIEIDTEAREVFDVSGAGDTVAAVFSLALAVGATPEQAAILANVAAGIVVAEVGAVAVRPEQIKAALQK